MLFSTELRVKELLRDRGWTTKVLAEKTGMSESYLTHIKNGTRRWNEDALKKLSHAFDIHPTDLFALRKKKAKRVEKTIEMPVSSNADLKVAVVPVVGEIPSNPSPYNNKLAQVTSGYKDVFMPVLSSGDDAMFCLCIENNLMAPNFVKGDFIIVSPGEWTNSGDIAAVEYGDEEPKQIIAQVTYMDEFIVLESVNHKNPPIALVRGKDPFRVIGKVVHRYQKFF